MRILIVHDIDVMQGGAEVVVRQTKAALEAEGHTVRILAGATGNPENSFADYTFTVKDSTPLGKMFSYLYNPHARRAVKRALVSFQPHVVHFHTVTRLSPTGVRAAKRYDRVVTFHDYGVFYPHLHRVLPKQDYCGIGDGACCKQHAGAARYYFEYLRTNLMLRALKRVPIKIVPSPYLQKIAEGLGLQGVSVVPNPIEVLSAPHTRKKELGDPSLLYVGRLEAEKGVLELLRCFAVARKVVPAATLCIAGDGSQRDVITARIEELGLGDAVSYLGHLDKPALSQKYRAASFVIIPSLWPEPFGLVGPEAMSAGTPVITSGRGGMSWLKDGVNGVLINPENTSEAGKRIAELLTQSNAEYSKLSRAALAEAKLYSSQKYVDALLRLY